ncbi:MULTISPECIES: DNA-processing protein DprA [unclassified Amycolatopsis]|uniref:DNA-processing protein DprA n=1 Tax=unclassified Amycolatopsis TaxID=2618356 RepID=UPI002876F291|nr:MULTISPECIES: DNA-processing protein DprA [unclassified Amycolatopsis]MDS0137942.1 DNA-protecting protein DprA [Amycolatopsis sp. 505]MDS0144145.1 DNA-protecting protein DprA [Amycolatopsis sp. CM201R]
MSADELRQARAYLLRVAEPPAPAVVAFVSAHGPIAAAARIRRGDCPDEVLKVTEARSGYDLVSQDFARAAEAGARLVVPEDDEWPAWPLHAIDVAAQCGVAEAVQPLALWVVGDVALGTAADRAVAIVGARAATDYGEHHAAEFAYGLAGRNVPVFSGAAYGIDGAAHRGALAAEGITAAVLGCAVDAGYPAGHVGMLKRVVRSGGAVISEYPPGTPPARHRFLVRNRLIAALTEGTLVVEAGRRSGARNTAGTAGAFGKVVMALPGPVSSGMSVGCHELIRDAKATLVSTVDEVLETVGHFGIAEEPVAGRLRRRTDRLGPEALRAFEALVVRADRSDAEVAAESGLPLRRVRALLPELEIDGFAVRGESGWRRRKESA